jgi:glycosyltransferase involved in cell wall biosynthesis
MTKVLYTTPILEHPAAGGPQLSVETCIKALNRESELHVISRVPLDSIGGIEAQRFYENYCADFLYSPSAGQLSANRYLRFLQRMWLKYSNQDVNFILKYFDEYSMDVIWCDRSEYSFDLICSIKKKRPDIKVVCDTCAVYSRFILRELPYETSPGRKSQIYKAGKAKEKEEKILVNLADVTTAVSEIDAQYYRTIAENPEKIHILSNVVDVETYEEIPAPVANFRKPCLYLAGTFYAPQCPMSDGARWLITEVLPLVRSQIPDIHLYIAGKGSNVFLRDIEEPGITMTGKLPSLLPYLCHADVSVVPLRFESGTRFKILEAGACNIPVVSTTLGAEGLSVTHGRDILIADDPGAFADAIISIITDGNLASEIAGNLKKLVRDKYSIASLAKEGRSILEYLVQA